MGFIGYTGTPGTGVHTGSHGIYQCYACCNSTKQWLLAQAILSVTITALYRGIVQGFRRLARAAGSLTRKSNLPKFKVSPRESPPVSLWSTSPSSSPVCLGPISLGLRSSGLRKEPLTWCCCLLWSVSPSTWSDQQAVGWWHTASRGDLCRWQPALEGDRGDASYIMLLTCIR